MTELERLAKEHFERYCLLTTGKEGFWLYLNADRKLAWMKEVIVFSDYLASQMKGRIKPLPPFKANDTVYMMGYQNGLQEERSATINLIQYIDQDLKSQLNKYIEQQKNLTLQDD